jgi:hypothetical protein
VSIKTNVDDRMINKCGAMGMKILRENQRTQSNAVSVPLIYSKILLDLTWK